MKTATKERPIIFSAPMVLALLEGRKTQTRRAMKPQPEFSAKVGMKWRGGAYGITPDGAPFMETLIAKCPYGQPGDRLWVRETWAELLHTSPATDVPLLCEGDKLITHATKRDNGRWNYDGKVVAYRATSAVEFCDGDGFCGDMADKADMPRWKSPIFMPRWASRITLEITEVRVQRVQEISEEDAKAEGISTAYKWRDTFTGAHYESLGFSPDKDRARAPFAALWDSINGKTHPWASNPWVWAMSFKPARAEKAGRG